ncbi:MAG: winged helix-turn-helix transcriptional regulator [Phycisphaeraceae bacterium]|nr:winged helix-turn-helix transcriptional regulator [Phycisphaeraceae bacterium]MCW5762437.1 winged helix-turn-helix transcriptional regulator [Phycisphaeraceae bacterium]
MARSATTSDVFNAIAEERRRDIIEVLARSGEQPVGFIVKELDLAQPTVSKHLSVLREVGIVAARKRGRERMYSLNAAKLKAVHEWTQSFERYWTHQTDRIKSRAEMLALEEAGKKAKKRKGGE